MYVFNNNKSILIFLLWAEVVWIVLFILTVIYGSWTSSLVLINSFYILVCTATEITLLSLIFINLYTKK